jgi:pyruvate-ferredoxin/flavodoxin oxidoreductase
MSKTVRTMDGNEAAAYVSYAFTEVAAIYPITPSSPMAELVDEWAAKGKKNLFGQTVKLVEMQSEAGAIGAVHGTLEAGALATSYTASQGLLLMIPTMYRIAGQLHPGVLHVSSRTVGTHALSICGDHSDVMSCRQTGFALLSSGSVQEVMDLGGVAHLSAIRGSVPFLHFFDGFRTSHEIQKIECLAYDDLAGLLDKEALRAFRKRSLNPERPVLRSTVQGPDVFFQAREASNRFYNRLPAIVEGYLREINRLTGRNYQLFNYYGAPDAENIIVAMGSVCGAIEETVDYLRARGEKVGLVQVHLFRPFSVRHLLEAIPPTVKRIAVLDRTKEPGAVGEPLYQDICAAYAETASQPEIYGGRYGLSSKDTTTGQIMAVYANLRQPTPKNHFTIGIEDDVTRLSLPVGEEQDIVPEGTVSCKFWGLGSDGTVGANKNTIKIIGEHTDLYAQAYFEYDTKKSGGVTKSHLRFGQAPIRSSYLVKRADFVACHNQSYLEKYDMVSDLKDGGTFLLNCCWTEEELSEKLPAGVRKYLAAHNIRFYVLDATNIAKELGLGNRINILLQAAFFQLAGIIPVADAQRYMRESIQKTYGRQGDQVVQRNFAAVDRGIRDVREIAVPARWLAAEEEQAEKRAGQPGDGAPAVIKDILWPVNSLEGDKLPVSSFVGMEDGTMPLGTSAFEKRGVASDVPKWLPDNCLQCNQCSLVCPHAAIRPFLLDSGEAAQAPDGFTTVKAAGKALENYRYRIQVSVLDCTGCGSCVQVCPAKTKALVLKPLAEELAETANWDYALSLSPKENVIDAATVKGSQFQTPLLEFSGACAGCGETPYIKLVTQLFGDRMYFANGTGCTQAWGAAFPSIPYTTGQDGHGPAWSNSLFENNAEFSLGMYLAAKQQRESLRQKLRELSGLVQSAELKTVVQEWTDGYNSSAGTKETSLRLTEALSKARLEGRAAELAREILDNREHLSKKSFWMIGGDGWAYDIGFGGLDHVMASGEDVNILVLDTEVYSNTGGQSSKATPLGAVAQFAASGKKIRKKDLGLMAMSYGYVYVAQVALGANPAHLLKTLIEAESYPGPSLVIAYAPCIAHGIKAGMDCAQLETRQAVEAGYWHLYRYNPLLKEQGKNPFMLDSKQPTADFRSFLLQEVRYSALERTFPEEARVLFREAEKVAREKYETYRKLAE